MIIIVLIAIAVLVAVRRVWSPWRVSVRGPVIHLLRMPIRARLVNQVLPLGLLVIAFGVNEISGRLDTWITIVPLVVLVATSLIPARYTLTTEGIAIGATSFRRWTEFSGVTVRRGRIRCKPITGSRGLSIWLPGRFHDADTVAEVRRLIRDAYQGRSIPAQRVQEPESDGSFVTI